MAAAAINEFSHNDPAGDHRQVRGQAALAAKVPQHGKVVANDRQEHLGGQVLAVGRGEHDRPAPGGVVNHVDDQAGEPIDKVFPGPRLSRQAAVEQIAVDVGERHGEPPVVVKMPLPGRSAPRTSNFESGDR